MDLSIVIPAYNEEKRLPPTLEKVISHLLTHFHGTYELIVVDNGSEDHTSRLVEEYIRNYAFVRLLRLPQNKGRGGAVCEGVKIAKGELVLEMDADGSNDEEAITRFTDYMNSHRDIGMVIGSRTIPGAVIVVPQPWLRVFLGNMFMVCTKLFFGWDMRDRVNGYKMIRRACAKDIFPYQYDRGFLAGAEIVYIAEIRGWKYELLPVRWTDNRASRVHPARDSWRSFWGLFRIIIRNWKGQYRGKTK